MVDQNSEQRAGAETMRKLNASVAAEQPYNLALAQPIAAPLKRRRGKRFYFLSTFGVAGAIGIAALGFLINSQLHSKFSLASIAVSAAKATVEKSAPLAGQSTGRTNFLIYGMTEDGMRTDSIMLASYYYQQHKLVTLNIPRDLYVNDGYENCKFGEVYSYAKQREPHNSTYPDQFVASLVSKEYGVPINYWVELNMQGEVSLVNSIGGINIDVPDSFTDYEYPTWNYSGYVRPAPSFVAGEQHMDGATALIYSRSRHSLDNNEGSDFARSKRQALVLSAVMTKVKSLGLIDNISKLTQYLGIVNQNVTTNLSTDEMLSAAKIMKGLNPTTDHPIANWNTDNGFLCDAVTSAGSDIVLYGVTGACNTEAGGVGESDQATTPTDTTTSGNASNVDSVYGNDSVYRQDAISYVQNLLQSVTVPATTTPSSSTSTVTPTTSSPAQ